MKIYGIKKLFWYYRYTLEGMIEMDEGYFTIKASENTHKSLEIVNLIAI